MDLRLLSRDKMTEKVGIQDDTKLMTVQEASQDDKVKAS